MPTTADARAAEPPRAVPVEPAPRVSDWVSQAPSAEAVADDAGPSAEWAAPPAERTLTAAESAAPSGRRFRLPVGSILTIVVIVGATAAGWWFNADRSDSGEITRAGNLTMSDLRVGDCFDLKDPEADEAEEVTGRPCGETHEYEVYYVGAVSGDAYPSEAAFGTYVDQSCVPAFDAYVGMAYLQSQLDIFYFMPTEESWNLGDHTVQCAVYDPRATGLTESLRGANR